VRYRVYLTEEAQQDLRRLENFLFELALEHGDFNLIERAMGEIRSHFRILEINPFTCRMAESNPYERELVIPFGGTGYVALFQILSEDEVAIAAIRHQREGGYN
jgi:plasmid stabilization system protein ParE